MNDFIFAGILASISRFLRMRSKRKNPPSIEVNLPEWFKFVLVYVFMFIWIKFVDLVFYTLFGV